MSAPELLWVKGNYTESQPSWKTVLWAVLQLWNGRCYGEPSEHRPDEKADVRLVFFKKSRTTWRRRRGHFSVFVYPVLRYKWCASPSARASHPRSAGFNAGRRSWDASWLAADSGAVLRRSVGGNTLSKPAAPAAAAALRYRGMSGARPRGPRRRGPTAPVGGAQNPISCADVLPRFGGATTSKSDLIVFDSVIIQRCRLFLLFLEEKDIIIQPLI